MFYEGLSRGCLSILTAWQGWGEREVGGDRERVRGEREREIRLVCPN